MGLLLLFEILVIILKLVGSLWKKMLLKFYLMESNPDLGMSLDSKSVYKELKVVTPEKSKDCITAFTKHWLKW